LVEKSFIYLHKYKFILLFLDFGTADSTVGTTTAATGGKSDANWRS